MSVFDSDPKFCPECGTIFPLPSGAEYISCMNIKCHYQVPVSGLYFLFSYCILVPVINIILSLFSVSLAQCFDTVGWAAGMASCL